MLSSPLSAEGDVMLEPGDGQRIVLLFIILLAAFLCAACLISGIIIGFVAAP